MAIQPASRGRATVQCFLLGSLTASRIKAPASIQKAMGATAGCFRDTTAHEGSPIQAASDAMTPHTPSASPPSRVPTTLPLKGRVKRDSTRTIPQKGVRTRVDTGDRTPISPITAATTGRVKLMATSPTIIPVKALKNPTARREARPARSFAMRFTSGMTATSPSVAR